MKKTLAELAALLDAELCGDGNIVIERIRGIDEAGPGDLTFLTNPKYRRKLSRCRADAILAPPGTSCAGKNMLLVAEPYPALGRLLMLFYPEAAPTPGISPGACVDPAANVSPEATIQPGAVVSAGASVGPRAVLYPGVFLGEEVVVGEDSVLYPNVVVYRRCTIGRRVILHAGVVIGADGFGFARPGVENVKIPQVGWVRIDDDVEIGANTTIDRGTFGPTWIQRGVKIDNLVQIGHNVTVGEYSVIVAQAGVSGSTSLGRGVIIGGQAGMVGHIRLGDHVMVTAQTGVHKDVPAHSIVSGTPHMPHRDWLRVGACLSRLPEMRQSIATLHRRLEALERQGSES